MLETVVKFALGATALYALLVALAWAAQERLAFPGPNARVPDPARAGFPDGRRIEVETADGVRLRGWYLPPRPAPPGPAPGLLWFYGNMQTVAELASVLPAFRPPGIGLVVLDYRGYGGSEGTPSEAGIYRDAEAAWRFLTEQPGIDASRIGAYGKSVGTAPALYLARERPVLRLRLDNLARARGLEVPMLVIHGTRDDIVPPEMGRAVADAAPRAELLEIPGAGHNDLYARAGHTYAERMHAFLDAALAER